MSDLGEHIEALRRNPASDDVANEVRRHARETGALAECAQAFTERAQLLLERDLQKEAIGALVEAALIYEEDLENLEAAADLYRKVLDIESDHRRALFALGLILHDLQRWQDLIELYRRRLAQSRNDGERTTLHLYIAELLSERLSDDLAAFHEVTTAARLAPRNIRVISRLENLGEKTGRIAEVAVVIGDLILHQEDPRIRAALSLRLAELHLGPLDAPQRALAYLRAALEDDGGNPEILSEVEDVFRERARFDQLAELLEHAAKDRRVGPHRVRLERELARIYELELGDKKRALVATTRAARSAPDDRELLDEVMRLGQLTQEMPLVAETFEDVLRRTDNALLRKYIALKLGPIYAETLDRPEDAIRVYWSILDEDPTHREARRRLYALHEERGEHAALERLLELEAQGFEGPSLAEPLRQLAVLRRDHLDDLDGAVDAYRRILSVLPDDAEALHAVATAPPARPPGTRPPPRHPGAKTIDLVDRVGASLFERDGNEATTEIARRAHARPMDPPEEDLPPDPSLPPPPTSEPFGGAFFVPVVHDIKHARSPSGERLVAVPQPARDISDPASAPGAGPVPGAASHSASLLRATSSSWATSIEESPTDLLAAALDEARDDPTLEHLEEVLRIGRVAGAGGRLLDEVPPLARRLPADARAKVGLALAAIDAGDGPDLAIAEARLASLLELAPDDAGIFDRYVRVLEVRENHAQLARVLAARAERLAGSSEAVDLVRRAAAIQEIVLEDLAAAAATLTAYLARAPERDDLRQEAAALLQKTERWAELVELLEAGVERQDGEDRVDLRRRIARLYLDRLEDPAQAARVLRVGLEERARDPGLLVALEEVHEAQGDHAQLVEAMLMRLETVTGARARNVIRKRIAEVAIPLGRTELASEMLVEATNEDPSDLEALSELERLRRERADWDGVLEVLQREIQVLTEPDARAATLVNIAQIHADAHADLDRAAHRLVEALDLAPDAGVALDLLATIEERRGDYTAAIAALRRLAVLVEGAERARVLVRIGQIYERRLEDTSSATPEYQRAHDADPDCLAAVLALFRVREIEEDYASALVLGARAAELTDDERARAALFRRAAQIARDKLGDDRRALQCYLRALEADPEDLATLASVGELLFEQREHAQAYPHLLKAAEGLSDPARAGRLFELAGLSSEALGRRDDAIRCYESALRRAPKAFEPLRRLSSLVEQREDWGRVYELSATLILHHEHSFSATERSIIYLRMARAKRATGDLPAAVRLARKASQLGDGQVEPFLLLADALAESGEPVEAASSLRRVAELSRASREKVGALSRAAGLLAERASDVAGGAVMLSDAQVFAPDDLRIAERLAELRRELGDAAGAAAALTVPAHLASGRARADLLTRAARAAAATNRERVLRRKLLAEALEVVPTHAEALPELAALLEFDGEIAPLVDLLERAARTFLEDPGAARDAHDLDRTAAAGRLYVEVLRLSETRSFDSARALRAVRKLLEIDPSSEHYREALADLLDRAVSQSPAGSSSLRAEAIDVWSRIVEGQPGHLDGLRRLLVLCREGGEEARARALGELLAALGDQSIKAPAPVPGARLGRVAAGAGGRESRVEIPAHPFEDTPSRLLFARLGYAPIRAFFDLLPEPKPRRRDLADGPMLGVQIMRPLEHAATLLGVEVPPVYAREDITVAVLPALVLDQPALVISPKLAAQLNRAELRFLLGRALSLLRPRALALALVPLDALRDALVGLARPAPAPEAVFGDPRLAKKRGRTLEKALPAADRLPIAELAARWVGDAARRSLADERSGVLRTSERAGMIASGSILASIAALKMLSDGRIERSWHIPLLEFAATRRYAEIVEKLG